MFKIIISVNDVTELRETLNTLFDVGIAFNDNIRVTGEYDQETHKRFRDAYVSASQPVERIENPGHRTPLKDIERASVTYPNGGGVNVTFPRKTFGVAFPEDNTMRYQSNGFNYRHRNSRYDR